VAQRFENKVALITGAARGQGRAEAIRLAEEGADIIAVDICEPLPTVTYAGASEDDLAETEKAVRDLGRRIVTFRADTRDMDALQAAVGQGVAELGHLDVVVANAGICIPKVWDQITPQIFADTMSTNVTGTWNTVMVAAPHLVKAGGGSIIIISSAAGLKVQPFMVPYTTSKFAVRGMAKAFAAELGQHNIRVNSVHPTGVNTPMGTGDMQAQLGAAIGSYPRLAGMFTNMLPVEGTEPEDVADTVLFLASDESKFITAHELAPDAGVTEF
jgi:SDR family mycofactocin-dependent oxidoreductase